MFDLIQTLIDKISNIFDLIVGFFEDILYIAKLLPQMTAEALKYINNFLPSYVVAIFITAISVTVIFRVIGRD